MSAIIKATLKTFTISFITSYITYLVVIGAIVITGAMHYGNSNLNFNLFASTAFDRDHHLQSRISNLTTITRLVSLVLRHVFLGEVLSLEKTIKQLHRSSRQKNDLPDMLTRVLSRYIRNPEKIFDDLEESGQDS